MIKARKIENIEICFI